MEPAIPEQQRSEVLQAARDASGEAVAAFLAERGASEPTELDPLAAEQCNQAAVEAAVERAWSHGYSAGGGDNYELTTLCMAIAYVLALRPSGVAVNVADVQRVSDAGFEAWELEYGSDGEQLTLTARPRR